MPSHHHETSSSPTASPRNAFTALMAPKRKLDSEPEPDPQQNHHHDHDHDHPAFKRRLALGIYLSRPASSFPPHTIIFQTPDFVAIHDRYPKSTIHTLLLPRSPAHNLLHPFEAFRDEVFLGRVQRQVERLRGLVARELQRRLGRYSELEGRRQAVLDGEVEAEAEAEAEAETKTEKGVEEEAEGEAGVEAAAEAEKGVEAEHQDQDAPSAPSASTAPNNKPPKNHKKNHPSPPSLPPGRDWQAEVITGVHAVPSMTHLHIHVLSRDMHSPAMKHRKHYNSFTTGFLVDVMDFPLREDMQTELHSRSGLLDSELRCWRCGRGFGNRFKMLKEHLEEEFLSWRSL
ncbi:hypothetical protein E4U55_005204 [Claviceps digitariae]|nr:hypothetical protein E4U55_005204 [Claviceps digitariae]